MINRRNLPLILMMTAGAVTCILTYIQEYSVSQKLLILLGVLVFFYFIGSLLSSLLSYFELQNENKKKEDGAVIEKEADTEQKNSGEETGVKE